MRPFKHKDCPSAACAYEYCVGAPGCPHGLGGTPSWDAMARIQALEQKVESLMDQVHKMSLNNAARR